MIYGILSFIISGICLAVFLSTGKKHHKYDRASATAASVRISYFLCLCAVPFLGLMSALLNSVKWATYTEAAVMVEGVAALLIGLMALMQRYGALFFKMEPAMERNEILFLVFLPIVLYLSYLHANYLIFYLLGPAIYSGYLLFKITRNA